jgi:hypothetical protein
LEKTRIWSASISSQSPSNPVSTLSLGKSNKNKAIQVSSKKLTEMKVDEETKVAFIANRKGEIKIYDFKEVSPLIINQNLTFQGRYKIQAGSQAKERVKNQSAGN